MPSGIYKRVKKVSNETKKKLSEARKGIIFSYEHRKKIGLGNKGKIVSDEVRKKISKYRTGKKHSKETLKKLSESHKGKKHSEESKKKMSEAQLGEKSHMWKGGISCLPYSIDWTRSLRISIRERDKYTCQICGEKQGDKAHAVHHIDYDKKNCNSDNLITLCIPCHAKTNEKREYWIEYFQ